MLEATTAPKTLGDVCFGTHIFWFVFPEKTTAFIAFGLTEKFLKRRSVHAMLVGRSEVLSQTQYRLTSAESGGKPIKFKNQIITVVCLHGTFYKHVSEK